MFPRGFITHVPHPISKAKEMWHATDRSKMNHREKMDRLYAQFCDEIKESSAFEKSPPTPICRGGHVKKTTHQKKTGA